MAEYSFMPLGLEEVLILKKELNERNKFFVLNEKGVNITPEVFDVLVDVLDAHCSNDMIDLYFDTNEDGTLTPSDRLKKYVKLFSGYGLSISTDVDLVTLPDRAVTCFHSDGNYNTDLGELFYDLLTYEWLAYKIRSDVTNKLYYGFIPSGSQQIEWSDVPQDEDGKMKCIYTY